MLQSTVTHHGGTAVNFSSDFVALADVCGMFGLACASLLAVSLLCYVTLIALKWRQSAELAAKEAPPSAADTRRREVTHMAVIMDGNRRFGKRASAQSAVAAGGCTADRERVIGDLCSELCYGAVPQGQTSALPFGSALSEKYRYFMSLIESTAFDGHRKGGEKLIEFIRYCVDARIDMLTVYAFSTDNWSRPPHEVNALMTLFYFFFERIRKTARETGIFVRFVSTNPELLPPRIEALMRSIENESRAFQPRRIIVNVCVSYGGQQEVLQACNRALARRAHGGLDPCSPVTQGELDGEMLRSLTQDDHEEWDGGVFSARVPREPQLVLRTSGEQRVSNFLLYECAYSEFVFTEKTWPEITREDLAATLDQYGSRDKRLGK